MEADSNLRQVKRHAETNNYIRMMQIYKLTDYLYNSGLMPGMRKREYTSNHDLRFYDLVADK